MPKITASNVIASLEELQQLQHDTMQYFRRSPLWKAIVKYVSNAKLHECALGEKEHSVLISKGSDGFSLERVFAKPPGAYPLHDTTVRFHFNVEFYDVDEDRVYIRLWMVDVPINLVEDFTEEKFKEWIAVEEAEFVEKKNKEDMETLNRIAKRNPVLLTQWKQANVDS